MTIIYIYIIRFYDFPYFVYNWFSGSFDSDYLRDFLNVIRVGPLGIYAVYLNDFFQISTTCLENSLFVSHFFACFSIPFTHKVFFSRIYFIYALNTAYIDFSNFFFEFQKSYIDTFIILLLHLYWIFVIIGVFAVLYCYKTLCICTFRCCKF